MNYSSTFVMKCLADNHVSQAIENTFADGVLKSGPEFSISTTVNLHVQKMYVFV